ncbi:hypothetical protein GYMLUDRAFT_252547 [Collybiopsis luxurians FD-317 M1]|uniref:Uncharacterized protein n=1 Tax=Collybiopsis luxurians FD-317 M1 TaxID=944289 RepID=A0A0D0AKW7_9AGAR|nr:hypothetical protein GYMLUDRAFT_252547 [Collybiopsis luxurians FD-317 M1]
MRSVLGARGTMYAGYAGSWATPETGVSPREQKAQSRESGPTECTTSPTEQQGEGVPEPFQVSNFWKATVSYVEVLEGSEELLEMTEESEFGLVDEGKRVEAIESHLSKYLRGIGVKRGEGIVYSRTAGFTEVNELLLHLPVEEFNSVTWETIQLNAHLFSVDTPIKQEELHALLTDHPNPPFILSVITALCKGFSLWATTRSDPSFPTMWDNTWAPLHLDRERNFVDEQCEKEIALGRHSPVFSPDLLPGMYSTPVIAVLKPHFV